MTTLIACKPNEYNYLVYVKDKALDTFSVLGFNLPDELAGYGISDIRDYYTGVSYDVSDTEGCEYQIVRLQ